MRFLAEQTQKNVFQLNLEAIQTIDCVHAVSTIIRLKKIHVDTRNKSHSLKLDL